MYSGVLPQPQLVARGIIPGVQMPVQHHTVLFTQAEDITKKERSHLLRYFGQIVIILTHGRSDTQREHGLLITIREYL